MFIHVSIHSFYCIDHLTSSLDGVDGSAPIPTAIPVTFILNNRLSLSVVVVQGVSEQAAVWGAQKGTTVRSAPGGGTHRRWPVGSYPSLQRGAK